jgi:hypothetical protein
MLASPAGLREPAGLPASRRDRCQGVHRTFAFIASSIVDDDRAAASLLARDGWSATAICNKQ